MLVSLKVCVVLVVDLLKGHRRETEGEQSKSSRILLKCLETKAPS